MDRLITGICFGISIMVVANKMDRHFEAKRRDALAADIMARYGNPTQSAKVYPFPVKK